MREDGNAPEILSVSSVINLSLELVVTTGQLCHLGSSSRVVRISNKIARSARDLKGITAWYWQVSRFQYGVPDRKH